MEPADRERIEAIRKQVVQRIENYKKLVAPIVADRDGAMATAFVVGLNEFIGWFDDAVDEKLSQLSALTEALTACRAQGEARERAAWEAGFKLCRSYGDNHAHFDGEQKERHWRDYRAALSSTPKEPAQ